MTAIEALRILNSVWGFGNTLAGYQARALEPVALPQESAMATCARIAGVDLTGVQPFDHMRVRALCAAREVALARE